ENLEDRQRPDGMLDLVVDVWPAGPRCDLVVAVEVTLRLGGVRYRQCADDEMNDDRDEERCRSRPAMPLLTARPRAIPVRDTSARRAAVPRPARRPLRHRGGPACDRRGTRSRASRARRTGGC